MHVSSPSARMTDEIIEEGTFDGRRAPSAFILYNNEVVANLKDAGTRITNEIKRDIGQQWKNMSNEDRQKYKHLAKLAKEDLAKQKALLPPKPKKRKLQNRISLKSIVGIVQKLSTDQRLAVELIGLGGLLQLRCTVLNHPLCNWLVKNFDPKTRSLTVHGRTFLLTVAHVNECLGINAEGKVIDLEVNMSDEFSQLCENIGMTKGVVQLKELREYLEETEEVGDVFKRKFALYMLGSFLCPTTKAGVTRSFMNGVSDVVAMGNQNWANLTLEFLCKGIQDQRDKQLVQPNGCLFLLVVFYFDRVSPSPTVMSYVRKFPCLVNWGDIEIKNILHEFDKIGGYDSDGVVVHFTFDEGTKVDEKTRGNEAGVSQISSADVSVMTSTFITVASLLFRQNMILAQHFGSEMLSDLQAQTGQQMDLKHGLEGQSSDLLTQLTGLHTCRTSSLNELETHDPMLNQAKAVEKNPMQASHLASEMMSKPHQEEQPPPEIAQQMNQSVILEVQSSPLFARVHTCETSTPNEFKTPDYALNKSKAVYDMPTSCFDQYNMGIDTRNERIEMKVDEDVVSPSPVSGLKSRVGSSRGTDTRKRKAQQGVDEVVGSPSPVSAFKSLAGLSRGRKKKLAFGKPVMSYCVNDNVEVNEPRRLRERTELKKSQFQRSPFTKDGLKKRNPMKNKTQEKPQSTNCADEHEIVDNIDINVPTFRGLYGKFKPLKFAGAMQELNQQSKPFIRETADSPTYPTPQPLNEHEKLLTAFIFDPSDPFTGDAYVHLKMFGIERFFATRYDLCSLKPKAWILDTIINLVAVQMTNEERSNHPDKRHLMWYLPVMVSRQILSNPNLSDSDLMKLCDSYFGYANFTADLTSCSMIYIPTNDRGNHWFCIKVDLGIQMAYIFDSKPATRSNLFRKRLTNKVMEVLHRALRLQYGDVYKADVSKFKIANVERQPLQHETDGYDCGLFVIKFMQGFNYPSGVHRMDDTERPRLLMDLLVDPNNREHDTVVKKFDEWKAKKEISVQRNRNVTLLIHYGGKLVQTPFRYIGGQVGECTPITGRMSYFELRDVIHETGCSKLVRVFYQVTATTGEIRLLVIDGDVGLAEMFDLYGRGAQIHIYLDDPLWSDDSASDSERERGIRSPTALRTTGKGRQMGVESRSARGRGRASGTVGRTGTGGARGDAFARGAATGKGR